MAPAGVAQLVGRFGAFAARQQMVDVELVHIHRLGQIPLGERLSTARRAPLLNLRFHVSEGVLQLSQFGAPRGDGVVALGHDVTEQLRAWVRKLV